MQSSVRRRYLGSTLTLLMLAAAACGDRSEPGLPIGPSAARVTGAPTDNVVLYWDEAILQAIRDQRHGPPMNARSLAIVPTAMYDAWAAYDDVAVGTQHGGALRRPPGERTSANEEMAISFAAYRTLVSMFPNRRDVFRGLMTALGYDPDDASTDVATPAGIGTVVAHATLAARAEDGSNQAGGYRDYTGYEPVNGPLDPTVPGTGGLVDPSRWQPLVHEVDGRKVVQRWVIPHWQYVTPFALTSADQYMPPPPAPVKSGEFHRQVQEIINLQAHLTDEQKVIAEYWADGPSSEFALSNAVFDAGIAVWAAKIHYDYVRPITAVRWLHAGKKVRGWAGPGRGTRVIEGDRWVPYQRTDFRTPPFAEYTSGHSAFSMAAAVVLQSFTGSDAYGDCATFPPGWTKAEPGIAPASEVRLCWPTFTWAAEEAGMSRLYGGIHFRMGNEESLKLGRRVGEQVWSKARTYFDGSADDAP